MITDTSKEKNVEWLFGGNPSAIVAQEKEGQKQLVLSSQLPIKSNGYEAKMVYTMMGIKVLKQTDGDTLFYDVELPAGWSKEGTTHHMWSKLLDDKGRERASLFYKAAFYDRDSFASFKCKINYKVDNVLFLNDDFSMENGDYKGYKSPLQGRVTDLDKIIFETRTIELDSKDFKQRSEIERVLSLACTDFLKENYPDYLNVNAYWD